MTTVAEAIPGTPEFEAESELLGNYVLGRLSEEEAEIFEHQLAEDAEFFARMQPMLELWYLREPLPIEEEALERFDRRQVRRAWLKTWSVRAAGLVLAATLGGFIALRFAGPRVVERVVQQEPADPTVPTAGAIVQAPSIPPTAEKQVLRFAQDDKKVDAVPSLPAMTDTELAEALPAPSAMRVGVHAATRPTRIAMKQWPSEVGIAEAKPNLSFFRALGNNLGALWGRVRHPRTPRQR